MSHPKEIDIARGIRMIEWLKAELVDGLATLFRALVTNSGEMIGDALATIIMTCYFLGKRLGLKPHQLDQKIRKTPLPPGSRAPTGEMVRRYLRTLHYMDEKAEERNNW